MTTTLWHLEVSPYNEKARWALDYKGIPHVRKAPLPGFHGFFALALTRGGQRRLPVLRLDGKTIGDSTAIIAALEQRTPDPSLYPEDPVERERALALEEYFDEEVAPAQRTVNWYHLLDDSHATAEAVAGYSGPTRTRVLQTLLPVMRPIVRRDYKVSESHAASAERTLRGALDHIETELQPSGYLVGEHFSVADLTAAALFTPLLAPPGRQYQPEISEPALLELRAELHDRPGGAWIDEMYARHRGESAEVSAS
jgi:glutathione S-transferase